VLEQVSVIRYVTPLREGGSLPALVEADNLGTYVMKFRGAGQGPKALVAEIIGGELARRLGLRTPEIVLGYLDPRIASSEPDPEIQDLLRASSGLNVGLDFLPGSAFHHNWPAARPLAPFDAKDHVLRPAATRLAAAHEALAPRITGELLDEVTALVPGEWLGDGRPEAYVAHLTERSASVLEVIR
jgi:hypothetical protein